MASGRWSVFPSQLRSSFGGIGIGAVASYGQLPYPSKIKIYIESIGANTAVSLSDEEDEAYYLEIGSLGIDYVCKRKTMLKVCETCSSQYKNQTGSYVTGVELKVKMFELFLQFFPTRFEILQDFLVTRVAAQRLPFRVNGKPGIIFIAH